MQTYTVWISSPIPYRTFSPSAFSSAAGDGATTSISDIHPDILRTHILTRLDGPTLAAAACTSSEFHRLTSEPSLWADICHSTWPSTATQRLDALISEFPDGPRSFFIDSFPRLSYHSETSTSSAPSPATYIRRRRRLHLPPELISAVDIYYRGEMIFSKVVETETVSGWFRCSPFRIDMLDPKDVIPTPIKFPIGGGNACRELGEDLTLSWIMIDAAGRRAMNMSSYRAVSVQRHWLSGEVQVQFATVLGGERGTAAEWVKCGIAVTCGGWEGGNLQVREVNLEVEDMDGTFLDGKDSLVILERAMEGKMGRRGKKIKLEEFLEKKNERKERKVRREGTLDMMCLAFGFFGFATLCLWFFFR
ncbi:probable F-box protein At2g36090 [Benincasa hispida]|uniref:probable F-box protein At2g36090 n=1 Tax=Benincasa hispida TaxID=102211 RepID=UPI0019007728|nr:probable F-box protein At2g36090 [Benincasa hispida]